MSSVKLSLQQKPTLKLFPTLRRSLTVLRLNQLELQQEIKKVLEENPFLEERKPAALTGRFAMPLGRQGIGSDFSWEAVIGSEISLQDYLETQLKALACPPNLLPLAKAIISSIDNRGFVTIPHAELAKSMGYRESELKKCLRYIQELEPSGIGAQDEWQALEWQAEQLYPQDVMLQDFLLVLAQRSQDLGQLNFEKRKELAELLHWPVEQVVRLVSKLKRMDPYPARRFWRRQENMIYPDVLYLEKEGSLHVHVCGELLPEIGLNKELVEGVKDVSQEWQRYLAEARSFLSAISFRQKTLLDFATRLLTYQNHFFQKGPYFLKPLTMRQVAREMNLNISTISRLVANKYCQCRWGIFPLRYFFVSKIKGRNGENYVPEDLRLAILRLIAEENPQKPLSDEKITERLQEMGFDVKRRTVAKYRMMLHLKSARGRKSTRLS
ncbi:MAG: RNA polymerase factor sigma-54 [Leptospiraceae bacterium]|nr:RNA polymerase factor sigma-54 [Leptospiraceae bacterium]MDW8306117.1 RNA polymerase factor sigma-54 [Leptospiraceae bacterium]